MFHHSVLILVCFMCVTMTGLSYLQQHYLKFKVEMVNTFEKSSGGRFSMIGGALSLTSFGKCAPFVWILLQQTLAFMETVFQLTSLLAVADRSQRCIQTSETVCHLSIVFHSSQKALA